MDLLGTGRVIALLGAVAVLAFLLGLYDLIVIRELEDRLLLEEQAVTDLLSGLREMKAVRAELASLNYLGADRGRQRPARH